MKEERKEHQSDRVLVNPPGLPYNDYLLVVGKVLHNAVLTEVLMANALRILLGCPQKTANAILFTLDAFNGKQSLLKRVVEASGDETDKKLIQALIAAAEKANDQAKRSSAWDA